MTHNKQEDEDTPSLAIASTTRNFREKGCSWPQHTLSWPATKPIKFRMDLIRELSSQKTLEEKLHRAIYTCAMEGLAKSEENDAAKGCRRQGITPQMHDTYLCNQISSEITSGLTLATLLEDAWTDICSSSFSFQRIRHRREKQMMACPEGASQPSMEPYPRRQSGRW